MSKAKSVVELAVFQALRAGVTGAEVYQDAPQDAPLPLVILGDMKSHRLATKTTDDDRRVEITIVSLVQSEQREPLLDLMDAIEVALDGQALPAAGWTLAAQFEEDDAVLSDDGTTYTGVSTFTVLALKG